MSYLFIVPLFIAVIYLASAVAFGSDRVFHGTLLFHIPPLIIALFPLAWLGFKYGARQISLPGNLWLYLCFLAPLAVIYPWVLSSSAPFGDYGGVLFFAEWLTKHPNFGPINIEVFIGILCILGVSLLPAFFANVALSKRNNTLLLLIFGAYLIMFVPVFIRLDLSLWIAGLFAPQKQQVYGIDTVYGPLLHTVPFVIMLWYVIELTFRKPARER